MSSGLYPQVISGPPSAGRVILPFDLRRHSGRERHEVAGNDVAILTVSVGDKFKFINEEGGQVCEVVAFDQKGKVLPSLFGNLPNSKAEAIKALMLEDPQLRSRVEKNLRRKGATLKVDTALRMFDALSPAKAFQEFTSQEVGFLLIAAPSVRMDFEKQNCATPIVVWVDRAKPLMMGHHALPDPLADPLQEIRVASSTAQSYLVKKGEYIQIIDVDGRQMTDFQCFSAHKLDKGIERPLDVTTTRSFMANSFPMPGMHSKYFDQDWDALVEVIQDTSGRHDAFMMACTAKYYDDIGYPGHANCSENFNYALKSYSIEPRPGWMAANFFYNTFIGADASVMSDESWSRPGDYVLMRALTDLVCVSSSCPDDTSSGNGWHLTDIHVRTYASHEDFKRAIAFRVTPNSEPKMTKETAFHQKIEAKTRQFIEYKGYWLPKAYSESGQIEEYWACREKAVVIDLSPLRKFEVTGPDAEALLQYCVTRDMKKLSQGQVVYTAMCYEHGGMIDDGTVYRLSRDNFRWIGGDEYSGIWLREQAEKNNLNVLVRGSTDQMHNLAIQGPNSREIMRRMVWTAPHQPSVDELGWFRFSIGRLDGSTGVPIVFSRTGYTGELGYEVFCHPKDGGTLYDAVWQHGADLGLRPMGLDALDMVRIEAGLIFAGYDFSDQTDPFEAGIGFTVPLKSKPDDFIGRDALIRKKENPTHKFVGLDIHSNIEVHHGDCLHVGRAQIGVVTSSIRSPLLGKNIALARVDVAHSANGTHIEVGKLDGLQKRLEATIVPFAHYDPKKTRPQS